MSNFFTHFPNVNYAFGDEFNVKGGANLTLSKFQDITAYIDLIDEVKQNAPFYSEYYVLENDRPDQVSQAIYGTPDYHWTFFICLLYTSPSPRDGLLSRMPSSA